MDNERKVNQQPDGRPDGSESTDLVERSKQVFLREIVNEFRRKQQQYDVGAEFAKTRRNRSLLVPLTILGLIVVFTGVVIAVTQYIQNSSRSIQVDIQDFADVNLRDVLNEAQRLQNQLDAARRDLEQVQSELQGQIDQVTRNRDREIQLLQERELSAAQRRGRAEDLRAQAQSQIDSLNAQYQPRIDELQARIADLQDQIAQYDSRQLEQAREQEEVLNNQQRVAELEKQQIRDEYETRIRNMRADYEQQIADLQAYQDEFERTIRQRHANEIARLTRLYNPEFGDSPAGRLLGAPESGAASGFAGIRDYSSVLAQDDVVSRSRFNQLRAQYDALQVLVDRLQQVPYENSIPPALAQIDRRTRDLVAGYENIRGGLEQTVVDRDAIIAARDTTIDEQQSRIDEFLFALDEFARVNGDTGYILDPRDTDNIVVYINRIRNVNVGSLGYVFRRDDEFVGTIRFVRHDGRIAAELVDTADEMQVRAFDKVLIDVQ